ncbi:MAG TPA: DUF6491 family protein [Gammaproteobacteria bacterium]|jgi:hypothetical protein
MKRSVLAALLVLGTASASWATSSAPGAGLQPAYEQIDSFHFYGRLDNWRAIDRNTLIVWTTPSRPYLVELMRGSPDLRFAQVIGLTSTIGNVHAKLDSVLVRGSEYPIKAIYRLNREQARELRQVRTTQQAV